MLFGAHDSPLVFDLVINAHYDDLNYPNVCDRLYVHGVRDARYVHYVQYVHDVLNVHLLDDYLNEPLNFRGCHSIYVILRDSFAYFRAIRLFYFHSINRVLIDDLRYESIDVIHDFLIDVVHVDHCVMVLLYVMHDRINLLNFQGCHDVIHYVIHYVNHYVIHDVHYFILNVDLNEAFHDVLRAL